MQPNPVAPRAYGAKADLYRSKSKEAAGPPWRAAIKNALFFAVCAYAWKIGHVIEVMLHSQRIYRSLLGWGFVCHGVLIAVGFYLTWVVGWKNPNWSHDERYNPYIHVATISMLLGNLLWIIAVWPVFHFWSIPLGFAGAIMAVTALTLFSLLWPVKRAKVAQS
jgi:hypothetical protein